MTTYATFTEHNQWEGETWRFYIPIEGNETQLALLDTYVTIDRGESDYTLDLTPVSEECVDYVVGLDSDGSYLAAFTKLSGQLDVEGIEDVDWDEDEGDPLYKGGIKQWIGADR